MPKTGTTTIQQALTGYDDGRTAYGGFSTVNHGLPLVTLFSTAPEAYRVYRRTGSTPKDVARKRDRFRDDLMRDRRCHSGRKMLVQRSDSGDLVVRRHTTWGMSAELTSGPRSNLYWASIEKVEK